ncbi:MAG: amidohydrolase [Bacteroidales bacterium]|nr:MAG: amidohydrolase [Bacteroidales bacterium]
MRPQYLLSTMLLLGFASISTAQTNDLKTKINQQIDKQYARYDSLYKYLHQHPELSFQEVETSKRMAKELRSIGFEVTTNFGGNGVVGIFKNGKGPVIMVRTDMDALPVEEKTGLPYESKIKAKNDKGDIVSVMHACGHDMHMTVFTGVANTMIQLKKLWQGTLIVIAQQAEERNGGSIEMLKDGLFEKFPVPNYALAFHVNSTLEAGTVGLSAGPFFATVDDVDITIYGKGGHGAYPQKTIDPIVIASRVVLDLQTIVSRELSPLTPAVITVGSFHGGTQRNIIPDEVKLSLTIRTYTDDVRQHILTAIQRIARGAALTAGMPDDKLPLVTIDPNPTPAVINDPKLTETVTQFYKSALGESNVIFVGPEMVGEDFGRYGKTKENIPILLTWLGSVDPQVLASCKENGTIPPPLHSPQFAPLPEKTIRTGILSMTYSLINLYNKVHSK